MKIKIVLAAVLGALQAVSALGVAWLLKMVTDMVLGEDTGLSFERFSLMCILYYCSYLLVYFFSRKNLFTAMRSIRTRLKERLFQGLLWESVSSHNGRKIGEVLARFQHQLDAVEDEYYVPMISLVKNVSVIMVSMSVFILFRYYAAFFIIVLFILYFALTHRMEKALEKLQKERMDAAALENDELVAMVKGYRTARDFAQEQYFHRRYRQSAEYAESVSCKVNFYYDVLDIIGENFQPVMTLLILVTSGLFLAGGSLTVGSVLGLVELVGSLAGSVGQVGTLTEKMKSTRAIRRSFDEYEEAGRLGKPDWTPKGGLPSLEKLTLDQVDFAYGDAPVLSNVSIELLAGKKYAFVGESGNGKSTLLKLILKQIEPQSGTIRWNGMPYSGICPGDLLFRIGYVAQQPMIFHASVRENVLAGADSEEAGRLEWAAEKSGLGSLRGLSLKESLPAYAPELSGGEKKRVACARALYKECEVLVLDELSSSISREMAREIERFLLLGSKRTILHVTHTLDEETAALYDGVFRVADGKVTKAVFSCQDSGSAALVCESRQPCG